MHMAFFAWQPGAILTSDCDEDVAEQCLSRRPNMARTPGAVGSCLASILEETSSPSSSSSSGSSSGLSSGASSAAVAPSSGGRGSRTLTDRCRVLADVAEPPNLRKAFDASLSVVVLQSQLEALESQTGMQVRAHGQACGADWHVVDKNLRTREQKSYVIWGIACRGGHAGVHHPGHQIGCTCSVLTTCGALQKTVRLGVMRAHGSTTV